MKQNNKLKPILLINPPNELGLSSVNSPGVIYPPGGLLILAACLEKAGFPVKLLDLIADNKSPTLILDEIKSFNPFFIGITSTSPQIRGATSLAKLIKEIFPNIIIGIGGPHPSAYHKNLKKIPYFDIIYVGEGEITLPKILSELKKNKKLVKKVYFGEEVLDLDSIPFMARHLLNQEKYSMGIYKNFSTMHTGRGCPFHCVYCSSPIEKRRYYKSRSVENIIEEIEYCVKTLKSEFILFTDDTFTTDRRKVIELCKQIINRKLKFKFACETRVELVDEELLSIMKRAGLTEMQFGLESGSERIRKEIIHKNFSQKQLENATHLCRKLGIYTIAFIMMGFPTETKKDLLETHKMCLQLPLDVIGIHHTVIMPGADLYTIAIETNKITEEYWNKYALGEIQNQPIYIPDGVDKEFMDKLRILTYKKFYLNPHFIFRRVIYDVKYPQNFIDDIRMALRIFNTGKTFMGRE